MVNKMNLQLINNIDNEIKVLYKKIDKLEEKRFSIIQTFPDTNAAKIAQRME